MEGGLVVLRERFVEGEDGGVGGMGAGPGVGGGVVIHNKRWLMGG